MYTISPWLSFLEFVASWCLDHPEEDFFDMMRSSYADHPVQDQLFTHLNNLNIYESPEVEMQIGEATMPIPKSDWLVFESDGKPLLLLDVIIIPDHPCAGIMHAICGDEYYQFILSTAPEMIRNWSAEIQGIPAQIH